MLSPEQRREFRRIRGRANKIVRQAIKDGVLTVPPACPRCGVTPAPNKVGVRSIHAHHEDHSKPLDVEWLCVACHRAETPTNPLRGEDSPQALLTDAEVRAIRQSTKPQRTIAAEFGICQSRVSYIRNRIAWPHIT